MSGLWIIFVPLVAVIAWVVWSNRNRAAGDTGFGIDDCDDDDNGGGDSSDSGGDSGCGGCGGD